MLTKEQNAEGYASDDVVDLYTGKDLLGFKGVKGFVVVDGKECSPVQIETAIKLHMSRSLEQERVQVAVKMEISLTTNTLNQIKCL